MAFQKGFGSFYQDAEPFGQLYCLLIRDHTSAQLSRLDSGKSKIAVPIIGLGQRSTGKIHPAKAGIFPGGGGDRCAGKVRLGKIAGSEQDVFHGSAVKHREAGRGVPESGVRKRAVVKGGAGQLTAAKFYPMKAAVGKTDAGQVAVEKQHVPKAKILQTASGKAALFENRHSRAKKSRKARLRQNAPAGCHRFGEETADSFFAGKGPAGPAEK